MGTEVLPHILRFIHLVIWVFGGLTVLALVVFTIEYMLKRQDTASREKLRTQLIDGCIGIAILLVMYLLTSAIGPAFRILFGR